MTSLWIGNGEARYPELDESIEVDVAIVGAGLSGAGALYALNGSGASVAVLESRSIASGASGRNAGFLLNGSAVPFGEACKRYGKDVALEIWNLTLDNNRLISQLSEQFESECDFLRRGSMSLAVSALEMDDFVDTAHQLAEAGFSTCVVDRHDLPQPFDQLYSGGLYYPGNGEIDPAAFVRAVVGSFDGTARIYEHSPVVEMRRGNVHELRTPRGLVRAGRVILATNAYTPTLLPWAPIAATRGQVLASNPIGRVIVPFPMYANFGYQYWRQTPAGQLVIGGWRDFDIPTEVGTVEDLHAPIQARLEDFCRSLTGHRVEIVQRWAGIMGFTPDLLPLAGRVPDSEGMYMAAGYSGHGVSMAFICGAQAARAVTGQSWQLPRGFDPARFT